MDRRQFSKLGLMSTLAGVAAHSAEQAAAKQAQRNEKKVEGGSSAYAPTILSIERHMVPEWFEDAKFGMFIDYGLYSIAGYAPKQEKGAMYPDWYLRRMYDTPAVVEYHKKTWGADFQRDDFIPKFTAESFDPEGLAQVAQDAGMRYVVPFCKHHDGFCLWPSSYTKRNAVDMGPKRDLIGPLVAATRKRGLKFGFYFSIEEWEYPILQNGTKMVRLWLPQGSDQSHALIAYDEKEMAGKMSGKIPVKDFFGDYIIPQAEEFIDRYDPDLLWLDGEWRTHISESRSQEFVSYLYNKAAGRKEVASNDRLGEDTRGNVGDFYTSEYGVITDAQMQMSHKWEENRGISQSFGYNWQDTEQNIVSIADLIDMLVRIVSENGNLLLIVNLDGKGAMPDYIRRRLADIGQWLKTNGEAIYATRPWTVAKQGDNLRFTQSKNHKYLYAIYKGWPQGEVRIDDLLLDEQAKVQLLGVEQDLPWKQLYKDSESGKYKGVAIQVPDSLRARVDARNAVAFRIQLTD